MEMCCKLKSSRAETQKILVDNGGDKEYIYIYISRYDICIYI